MLTMVKSRLAVSPNHPKNALSSMDLFQNIPNNALRIIEKEMVERTYSKNDTLFSENDPALSIWFVKKGHVREVNHSMDGKVQTVCMVGTNGIFGISAFDGGEYGFHSIAETLVTAISFPIQYFQSLMDKYPELTRIVVTKISKLLRQSRDLQSLSQEPAEKRLIHVLCQMWEEFGNAVPLTRRAIASMAGTAPETCSRIFSRLEEAGLIQTQHRRFIINDVESLKSRIQ